MEFVEALWDRVGAKRGARVILKRHNRKSIDLNNWFISIVHNDIFWQLLGQLFVFVQFSD